MLSVSPAARICVSRVDRSLIQAEAAPARPTVMAVRAMLDDRIAARKQIALGDHAVGIVGRDDFGLQRRQAILVFGGWQHEGLDVIDASTWPLDVGLSDMERILCR